MLFRHRGPLPVLGVALAVFCVSEGVAAAQTTPREVALKYAVDNAESLGVKPTDMTNLAVTSEYRSASVPKRGVCRREPRARDQRPRGRR